MNTFKSWLPVGITICVLSGMICLVAQQNYRMNANDPQIQVAQDLAAQLSSGQSQFNLPTGKTDIGASLAPVIMVIDDTGKALYNSASLGGKDVMIPSGVLDYTKANGEDRVTWQPKPGVRMALVVKSFVAKTTGKIGYVAVAKSLTETEKRINNLNFQVGGPMLLALVGSFIAQWFNGKKMV